MDKHRQSSAAAFPPSWVPNDDPLRKVSFEYPPDRPMYQAKTAYDKDPIRTAHVDQFKEDYQELDEYASVILEYGELPDPDHCEYQLLAHQLPVHSDCAPDVGCFIHTQPLMAYSTMLHSLTFYPPNATEQ